MTCCKLMAGSWGTPRGADRGHAQGAAAGRDRGDGARHSGSTMRDAAAAHGCGHAARPPRSSAAAHLPAAARAHRRDRLGARRRDRAAASKASRPSVAHRCKVLDDAACGAVRRPATLERSGLARVLARGARRAPFAALDTRPRRCSARPLWRISTAPTRGAEVGCAHCRRAGAEVMFDWAGGLVWARSPLPDDADAPLVRAAVAAAGGHATLIRAPGALRRRRSRLPAAARRARGADARASGTASIRAACSIPAACGRASSDADLLQPWRRLADPHASESEKILRACVHCGFCTATCPTYVLLGDELDSPARAHLPDQGHARDTTGRRPPRS